MARGYRPVRRDQLFLLPPDMTDWLPDDHLVWFLLDLVAELDTSGLHARYRTGGVGRAAYDPDMLLALVVYAWSQQVRSSRRIQRLCEVDVAFRLICAGDLPHHATISRFVAGCQDTVAGLFTQVLALCARAGLVRLGLVALDGTKIEANASLGANRTRTGIDRELARLAENIVAEQVATDTAEDTLFADRVGDELPTELTDRTSRRARLRAALDHLDRRDGPDDEDEPPAPRPEVIATGRRGAGRPGAGVDRVTEARAVHARVLAEVRAHHDQATARREARTAAGRRAGRRPVPPEEHHRVRAAAAVLAAAEAAAARAEKPQADRPARHVNVTDPDSRVMPTRRGWIQGYNAQLVACSGQVILAADVTDQTNDVAQYLPMADAAQTATAALPVSLTRGRPRGIGLIVADSGYWSPRAATHPGPDRLIATASRRTLTRQPIPDGPPDIDATTREQMTRRLLTPDGRESYKQRGATIEPVNGQIKDVTGLRRFRRRGMAAVRAELVLTCTIHNLLKLHRATGPRPATS
ncbi:hypothetical protein ACG83_02955 [Frankia sp. R43]|uniref:transposase n=1 Tax=Frankia sp. R43 TaxID=269536 RepID=UPI0006CA0384|nr:transposase [Frankia sp. R43]KPM50200.1 hypothetical protein ACG83_41650 [Frankia sp. R43]KPM54850.1 hypothetical protein ACG83_15655 [Frankia sp. R43]KPM56566.1 hypothetical protein ACG83_01200 [Frankia sp. R43]KPM56825.1 hypothetical protein ACG83_02955 [Frankia sp. R43]